MSSTGQGAILGEACYTSDAFLAGRLTVLQPVHGFRAGLDSVLLGAALPTHATLLADLGAGVGTASLVALTHNPRAEALLVENDADMLAFARQNIEVNGYLTRASAVSLDLRAPRAARHAAGLAGNRFDAVIANPPFFATGAGTLASARGRAARHMPPDDLQFWVEAAMTALRQGGEAVFILPAQSLALALSAFSARRGAITVLPLSPRPDAPASRILLRWRKESGAPLALLATRPLHASAGQGFAPEFDAIFRGETGLHW